MRKVIPFLLVLFIAFMFFGCDQDSMPSPRDSLSPPSWIRGTWSDEYGVNTYAFSSSNVIFTVDLGSSSIEIDFAAVMESSELGVVDEISTSSMYRSSFNDGTSTTALRFENVSSTTLNYYISEGGITSGPIRLTKE